jgi:hypothetical protein
MSMTAYFFIVFLATIFITRLTLYFCPFPSPTIGKFRMHHYMYGIALLLIGLLAKSILVYSIGMGLFFDELTYLIIRGKNHQDNYSAVSLVGTFIFIAAAYFLKDYLVMPFK